eukprot:GHVL01034845.1.p1 GENE.GHVL01034845.1~~GHVL01034845.1.p1  ORF type:complete len:179 (+),score=28.81 GHVL01034845.1:15-551(+)
MDIYLYFTNIHYEWNSNMLNKLNIQDKERVSKFRFENDKKTGLISCILQRYVLQNISKLPSDQIIIERSQKIGGRPIWMCPEDLHTKFVHFNVSHDNDLVVLVASGLLCGVDCMYIKRRRNKSTDEFFRLMKNTFTDNEWKFINTLTDEENRLKNFFLLWTMKESYVKSIATGASMEL